MSAGPAPAPHRPRVRRGPAPVPPRRVSGAVAVPRAGVTPPPSPLGRWPEALRGLPDARWVDRLLRGRAWIALIAVALIGIVAMQVHLLKLNGGIGRAVEHSATLERQNAELRGEVAKLSSQEHVQTAAGALGLALPPAGDVRYVEVRRGVDARRAARAMRTPNTPQELAAARLALAQQRAALGLAPDPAAAGTAAVPGAAAAAPSATGTAAAAAPAAPAAATDPAAPPGTTPAPATAAAAPAPAVPAPTDAAAVPAPAAATG